MNRDQLLDKLARDYSVWPVAFGLNMRWTDNGNGSHRWSWVYHDDPEGISFLEWDRRRIELGLEKATDHEVTPEEDDAWNEKRMDAIGLNGGEALHYDVTPVDQVEFNASKSDGSTASYYELPEGCTELQDLISYRNLNAQDGEIFRAIYRKGRASHSDDLRDAKKVLFYAQAEVERLLKLKVSP